MESRGEDLSQLLVISIPNILRGEIIVNAGLDLLIELNLSNYGFYYVVCSIRKHFALWHHQSHQ